MDIIASNYTSTKLLFKIYTTIYLPKNMRQRQSSNTYPTFRPEFSPNRVEDQGIGQLGHFGSRNSEFSKDLQQDGEFSAWFDGKECPTFALETRNPTKNYVELLC